MKKIDYYFDFLSPFSYFSWKNTTELRNNPAYQVALKPVVMGTLFNHWGIKGPGEIASKRYLMLKQCFIYAAKNNIPFCPPKQHPFNPLYVLRLATSSCASDTDLQSKIIDCLWKACWEKSIDLGEPERIIPELNAIGLDGEALIDKTFDRDVKVELKQNTKEAIAKKVFGVPTFAVDDEIFWGNDNLENLNLYLTDQFPKWDKETFLDRSSDIFPESKL